MKFSINDYQTLIFDCDGVILNSNSIKTQAFYDAALSYGVDKAEDLVEYHIKNGGISRYQKFDFFLKKIVGCEASKDKINGLLTYFSKITKHELLKCEINQGIFQLREELSSDWIVISGGNQDEINEVFSFRKIDSLFLEGCIFGSPDPKEVIFDREIKLSKIKYPALFIGDSQSMTVESAMLGTPNIRFSNFVGKISILEEIEKKYNLSIGISADKPKDLLNTVDEIINNDNSVKDFKSRRDTLLKDKIDVTAFMVWFIENYPLSKKIMKENPDYQYNFK